MPFVPVQQFPPAIARIAAEEVVWHDRRKTNRQVVGGVPIFGSSLTSSDPVRCKGLRQQRSRGPAWKGIPTLQHLGVMRALLDTWRHYRDDVNVTPGRKAKRKGSTKDSRLCGLKPSRPQRIGGRG